MRRKRFSEDQVIRILEEFESSKSVPESMGIEIGDFGTFS